MLGRKCNSLPFPNRHKSDSLSVSYETYAMTDCINPLSHNNFRLTEFSKTNITQREEFDLSHVSSGTDYSDKTTLELFED